MILDTNAEGEARNKWAILWARSRILYSTARVDVAFFVHHVNLFAASYPLFLTVRGFNILWECVDTRVSSIASCRLIVIFSPQIDGSNTTSKSFGRSNTRAVPPVLYSSQTSWLVEEHNSASAIPSPSWALPIKARREGLPHTQMAEIIAVKIPMGAIAKMK